MLSFGADRNHEVRCVVGAGSKFVIDLTGALAKPVGYVTLTVQKATLEMEKTLPVYPIFHLLPIDEWAGSLAQQRQMVPQAAN